MKISHNDLLTLEESRGLIIVQSDFSEIAYAVDKYDKVMWLINRQTGAQLEISAENAHKLADEIMSVAEIFLRQTGLWKKGA